MKKVILLMLLAAFTMAGFSQGKSKDRIKFIKVDTTQVDSTGAILEITTDYEVYPVEEPDTVKGVVLNQAQMEQNIAASTELIKYYRALNRARETAFEAAVNPVTQRTIKQEYEQTEELIKRFVITLREEQAKQKAFKKLTK